ncbi:aldehyde dehydrogenase (NADP(+)) [Ferrimonas sp. YFM]|uniref:aldehyde dehydrogenase (NADP(+)) n=1 Tax=Ferrimonas sp. YFM TaxID=3028878 RepID=UPI002574764F|nr:aldehyde dehydrogenase (NADP(+)) [Ferrimonas sp. YFM]BDY04739.1 aldehyde dehydrogenase [Ferrimonas sp. YFM]
MNQISGQHLINGQWTGEPEAGFSSFDPERNEPLPWQFSEANTEQLEAAVAAADSAFMDYRLWSAERRAQLLEAMADAIDALGERLTQVAAQETALPEARLNGERGRTCGQLRLFAQLLRQPKQPAIIDLAQPDRQPLPKPDIRLDQLPLGPVAVFGASNFPLAFSAAGGDTASALAAGCPVVIKGHPAHPATSELVAQAVLSAIEKVDAPRGVFNLLQSSSPKLSQDLVRAAEIQAVGFTGSFRVGQLLSQIAAERPQPIPFFGELGSINPQLLLPRMLAESAEVLAEQQHGSMMMGQGQFCTSPGLVLMLKGEGSDRYLTTLARLVEQQAPGTMLTPGIARAYAETADALVSSEGVSLVAQGQTCAHVNQSQALVANCSGDTLAANPDLLEEVFGPCTLVVTFDSPQQLLEAIRALPGQLTASVHGTEQEMLSEQTLMLELAYRVGRLIANQMPTGVEVCHAMQHGGPWPASTHSQSTSVGAEAIKRFTRPLAWQNLPQSLLPEHLCDQSSTPQLRY